MFRRLEKLRIGNIEPHALVAAESSKRAYNLELSKHRDFENVHSGGVNTLDIDCDGRYLLSGCSDGSVYIHNLFNFTGSPSFTANAEQVVDRNHKFAHRYSVECVQWYPQDSGLFVTGSMDKQLRVWDSNRMCPVDTVRFEGRIFQVHMSPISLSKCLVAVTSSESKVRLVDLNSGSCAHELRGHESAVLTCRWSPRDEFLLATGGCDGRILLWDARSVNTTLRILDQNNGQKSSSKRPKPVCSHEGAVNGLCYTENGHHLLSLGTDSKVKLWNLTTGKNENVNYGAIPTEIRKCIQFDVAEGAKPELTYIPSDGSILVFEVHSGKKVKTLYGHYNLVNSCKFNPLYQELYSGGNDRSVLVWTADHMQSEAYEEHVNIRSGNTRGLQFQNSATQDAWSSDESADET